MSTGKELQPQRMKSGVRHTKPERKRALVKGHIMEKEECLLWQDRV